ncbi:MAG: type II toxin-antitoxin system RelE/ParE family toxin [Synergistaceae bacterium]|jgi:putative addiction module killer protein|nr:type II toxin-antitoxin system RelE/ParE family toxin [Synergistaceae bacterium]
MEATSKRIIFYKTPNGDVPFESWFRNIANIRMEKAVLQRMERVLQGNYGDCESVGEGVLELRFRAFGVRIYFKEIGGIVVLLLCAGDKKTQVQDIARAKAYWQEYNSRISEV